MGERFELAVVNSVSRNDLIKLIVKRMKAIKELRRESVAMFETVHRPRGLGERDIQQ